MSFPQVQGQQTLILLLLLLLFGLIQLNDLKITKNVKNLKVGGINKIEVGYYYSNSI